MIVMTNRLSFQPVFSPSLPDADGSQRRLSDFHGPQPSPRLSLGVSTHTVAEVRQDTVDQNVWLLIALHRCSTLLFDISKWSADPGRTSPAQVARQGLKRTYIVSPL
jgi:hypothetical protein